MDTLATSKAVDTPLSPNCPWTQGPECNQPSRLNPSFANDPSHQPTRRRWRAEVASRVNSYRARRKRRHAEENSPALDFGPADGRRQNLRRALSPALRRPRPASNATRRDAVRSAARRNAARNAFDTNYYRRLNAESMAQGSRVSVRPQPPQLRLQRVRS